MNALLGFLCPSIIKCLGPFCFWSVCPSAALLWKLFETGLVILQDKAVDAEWVSCVTGVILRPGVWVCVCVGGVGDSEFLVVMSESWYFKLQWICYIFHCMKSLLISKTWSLSLRSFVGNKYMQVRVFEYLCVFGKHTCEHDSMEQGIRHTLDRNAWTYCAFVPMICLWFFLMHFLLQKYSA